MFDSNDQYRDWEKLHKAIEEAPEIVPCTNFPDAFYPEVGEGMTYEIRWAKQMCGQCPVKTECAVYGLKHEQDGIWGGMTPNERKAIRRAGKAPVRGRPRLEPLAG